MKRVIIIFISLVIIGGGVWAYASWRDSDDKKQTSSSESTKDDSSEETAPETTPSTEPETTPQSFIFAAPKKSAHYVSNTPAHEAVLDSAPAAISITFNFDLSPISTISVLKDGKEVSTGNATVSGDKLTLTKSIAAGSGSGLYTVNYNACWPDGSCHDGHFQFGVK